MEDPPAEEQDQSLETEVAPALIAVHPAQQSVAVAVGSDLRVFSLQENCSVSLVDDSSTPFHKGSIRAIRYGAKGNLFVSAGDDKLLKIWTTNSWRCICTVSTEKRVTAVSISNDGLFVCFADKFGVVWVVDLDEFQDNQVLADKKPAPLLAHYCSIITSLEFSPNGGFIVSADRDFKIRATVFPKKPLDGAHVIQSFCLGHTQFVSCITFISNEDNPQGFLVSGSGDSTVRLWDIIDGSLLDTCEVGVEAGLVQSNGVEEENYPAVMDLSATPDGSLVAVAIESFPGIVLLSCNFSARTLSIVKVISISGGTFIPTSLGTSSSTVILWMVMGVSNLNGSNSAVRVRAISPFAKKITGLTENDPIVLDDDNVPGGQQLLQKLQGTLIFEKEIFSAAAEAVKISMRNLLIKKQYSAERREFKKRGRNDKKMKQ